jgi:hypothetical protein
MNSHRGALHVHSTYSDGEYTLPELRERFLASGCSFACVTDHAEAFDAAKLAAYVAECERLSDERFRFIAGLEYECRERMHVLGYGVTDLLGTTEPEEVIAEVERRGGVAVIAHPKDSHFPWIESFERLPGGVEAWNTKYDGRYAPRPRTFALVGRLRQRRPGLLAFYGQDLHWKTQYAGLWTLVRCEAPEREQVLAALARGDFAGSKGRLELPSSGELPRGLLRRFGAVNRLSSAIRRALKGVKRLLERCGGRIPAGLKRRMRRAF